LQTGQAFAIYGPTIACCKPLASTCFVHHSIDKLAHTVKQTLLVQYLAMIIHLLFIVTGRT